MTKAKTQVIVTVSTSGGLRTGVFKNIGEATKAALAVFGETVPGVYNKGRLYEANGKTVYLNEVTTGTMAEIY